MTNKLFTTIVSNVGTSIQDTSSAMQTIIKVYANNAYREILRRVNWDAINQTYTISAVAGTQDYALPSDFGKELYVLDTTNDIELDFISLPELIQNFPSTTSSQGLVERYCVFLDNILTQPSAASLVTFSSSSSADTTQSVFIKGTNSSDLEISETITLNGTTGVLTTLSYKTVSAVSKSSSTTGVITGTSNSGAVTIASMSSAVLDYKVRKLRLHQVPTNALTIKAPYHVKPSPLTNDYDTPVFDCADGIELGAIMQSWRYKRQFEKAQEFERLFEKWIVDQAWDMENQPNQTKTLSPKTYDRDDI